MSPAQLAALDAWIADQTEPFTRPEAIRAMVGAALELMGRGTTGETTSDEAALGQFLDRFESR